MGAYDKVNCIGEKELNVSFYLRPFFRDFFFEVNQFAVSFKFLKVVVELAHPKILSHNLASRMFGVFCFACGSPAAVHSDNDRFASGTVPNMPLHH